MRFGALPAARDPNNPTAEEKGASARKLREFQAVFHTH
jgi:hypothetical protein